MRARADHASARAAGEFPDESQDSSVAGSAIEIFDSGDGDGAETDPYMIEEDPYMVDELRFGAVARMFQRGMTCAQSCRYSHHTSTII